MFLIIILRNDVSRIILALREQLWCSNQFLERVIWHLLSSCFEYDFLPSRLHNFTASWFLVKWFLINWLQLFFGLPRDIKILVWCPAGSFYFIGEGASLPLVGHPCSDSITTKLHYGVDVLLHWPALHPIFSKWVG